MTNFLEKNVSKIAGGASAVGAMLIAGATHAAADADLVAAGASTTAIFTDNKGEIITIFVGIITAITIIGVVFALLNRAKRMAIGVVSGGKRRR